MRYRECWSADHTSGSLIRLPKVQPPNLPPESIFSTSPRSLIALFTHIRQTLQYISVGIVFLFLDLLAVLPNVFSFCSRALDNSGRPGSSPRWSDLQCDNCMPSFTIAQHLVNRTQFARMEQLTCLAGWHPKTDLPFSTEANGGTRISSTRYVHYGTISALIRTSKVRSISMPTKSIGNGRAHRLPKLKRITSDSAGHGTTVKDLSDTYVNYHNYTIDWQEQELNWFIDGKVVRTLKKADTLNNGTHSLGPKFGGILTFLVQTKGRYEYPSTPSRVQLSLWPAGINSSAPGTIEWAGGMINWQDPDYIAAAWSETSYRVKCAPLTGVTNASAMTSYTYSGNDSTGVPAVQVTNQSTLLGGAIPGVSVGYNFWLGVGAGMLCAVAGVFSTVLFTCLRGINDNDGTEQCLAHVGVCGFCILHCCCLNDAAYTALYAKAKGVVCISWNTRRPTCKGLGSPKDSLDQLRTTRVWRLV
ncbi:glycosyl hydrolases family 16 domain-containing protein [Rhizoctonia solani AG-1 IA]|uniref:Glycosyl hydrolases family 16 domain-containing protein n=1 Tax=Thanatephorus cucumeris (strain AG1-IA) TaxID=983506 RepID=L8WUT3_THACA|nr:glycosyl hydrolases family 16 domain-containing protein [Rhizoctonia solani AG-1 IA]